MSDLIKIQDALVEKFKIFEPLQFKLWLNPESVFAKQLEQNICPNLRCVVGKVSNIKNAPRPNNYEKVSLSPIKKDDYRAWYEQLYSDFHMSNVELKDWVPVNDAENMDACLKDGLIYFVHIENEKVGLIAAKRKSLLGKSGIYMTEILLSKDFKGKGYAPAIQRKFIDEATDGIELVWGTIDARNVASTRTAFRVGRNSIRTEFFIPIS
ncbi:MAG: GNAT family N-acetyltransferase [Bdellovibrionales bacterium]|nr:GNAT family N-acetyltransferase [Bdellovibrionales bacterium]